MALWRLCEGAREEGKVLDGGGKQEREIWKGNRRGSKRERSGEGAGGETGGGVIRCNLNMIKHDY